MPMRYVLALILVLCGAANAEADTNRFGTAYCSNGFEKPAVITAEGELKIGGALKGEIGFGDLKPFRWATVSDTEGNGGEPQDIIIFRDRVFWPCPK